MQVPVAWLPAAVDGHDARPDRESAGQKSSVGSRPPLTHARSEPQKGGGGLRVSGMNRASAQGPLTPARCHAQSHGRKRTRARVLNSTPHAGNGAIARRAAGVAGGAGALHAGGAGLGRGPRGRAVAAESATENGWRRDRRRQHPTHPGTHSQSANAVLATSKSTPAHPGRTRARRGGSAPGAVQLAQTLCRSGVARQARARGLIAGRGQRPRRVGRGGQCRARALCDPKPGTPRWRPRRARPRQHAGTMHAPTKRDLVWLPPRRPTCPGLIRWQPLEMGVHEPVMVQLRVGEPL